MPTHTLSSALEFDRSLCRNFTVSGTREWLVTNGIGGFASGTVAGVLTRRYHGLLIAALHPPLGRTLLASKVEETVTYDGRMYALTANVWRSGVTAPTGFYQLERFYLDGAIPVWEYSCADALLEKRIWMQPGENSTYLHYQLRRATLAMAVQVKVLVNYRDYHGITHANNWRMEIEPVAHGLGVTAYAGATPYYLLSDEAQAMSRYEWYRDFHLSVEAERGLDANEDHLYAGEFAITLAPGAAFTLVLSTNPTPNLDGAAMLAERQRYEQSLLAQAKPLLSNSTCDSAVIEKIKQLVLAADQFIVTRPMPNVATAAADDNLKSQLHTSQSGHSIIAGYPWFGDWGRDTMIALPGLTLVTGRPRIAASILRTFAQFVDQGMLPNRFPDAGEAPEYNTADATLWYFEALRAYYEATRDVDLLHELFPTLEGIIRWHQRGTRYRIHVDPTDGLLYAGEPGVQLTWMDAKIGDWVVTPRTGKAVELNALWYNALSVMADFAHLVDENPAPYNRLAEQTQVGFGRFWSSELGYCYDVLDTPEGYSDATLRPNQILAVALPHSPLSGAQQRAIVDLCARQLLTPYGLRSLAPGSRGYASHYSGTPLQRDSAYHQGTVWGWLLGPFVLAHLRVYHDQALARSYLLPMLDHLADHGIGSLSEIFDAEPPFTPRGCFAQAWSVAETLRAWHLLNAA